MVQQRHTHSMIQMEGRPVALVRTTMISDGAGGQKPGGTAPLAAVRRWFVPVRPDPSVRSDEEGAGVAYDAVLIGEPDDVIEPGDHFFIGTLRYKVLRINEESRAWECRALCEVVSSA